ncbi:MAG TPA: hypothetical protein VHO23_03250, partial [Candidatus Paceibacterota bacterium]|nr:hypothetical protein [Candidatus Paceibacterota bacterium]
MTAPINWQQFGLKSNPYDTLPLVEGGELALEEAFVGREKEREFLDGLFDSEDRVCLTVCGDVGVGKTSLANVQKYEWKYRKPKLLFSFRREIEACDDVLSKRGFITEILASVVREIKLLEPSLLKEEVLMKVVSILDVSQNISISGGISASYMGNGASVEFARAHSASQPLQISTAVLEEYLRELLDFVRTTPIRGFSYSGLVVHMNNFDVVLAERDGLERTIRFFNEVRDILQTRHLYFLFLGPRNLFKEVISA